MNTFFLSSSCKRVMRVALFPDLHTERWSSETLRVAKEKRDVRSEPALPGLLPELRHGFILPCFRQKDRRDKASPLRRDDLSKGYAEGNTVHGGQRMSRNHGHGTVRTPRTLDAHL